MKNMSFKLSEALSILALVVATGSAAISYRSFSVSKHQSELSDLQIRPYVRYRPVFEKSRSDELGVTMISENLTQIPARVIYDELRTWVDGVSTGAFLYNRSGDVLYEHHSGGSALPPLPKQIAKAAIAGKSKVMIGTCVVYRSLSSLDERRWEVRALYSYAPNAELPSAEFLEEVSLDGAVDRCDSKTLWSEWQQSKQKPPTQSASSRN
jgi:hypothetical protein